MNKFEDQLNKKELLKSDQEKAELDSKEGTDIENKEEKEASQEELDKTLGEINESVEDINETLNEATSIKSELESLDQRERNMFRERVDNWIKSYAQDVSEIESRHKKVYLALAGGAAFFGGIVASIPYIEGMSFVESIKLLRTGFPMALGMLAEAMLAATAIVVKIQELIDKSNSRRQQDEHYFGGFDRMRKGEAKEERKRQIKLAKLYKLRFKN